MAFVDSVMVTKAAVGETVEVDVSVAMLVSTEAMTEALYPAALM